MLAVVAGFVDGQLTITGDTANDVVSLSTVDVGGIPQVTVNGQGVGAGVNAASVTSISAKLGGGNDTMNLSALDLSKFSGLADESVTLDGEAGNDVLTGTSLGDVLIGGAGNDTLVGGAGDDELDGGAGQDVYSFSGTTNLGSDTVVQAASANIDTLQFANLGGAIVLDISLTTPQVVRAGQLTLTLSDASGIDNVQGTAYADAIYGNSGGNSLIGNGGNDSLYGRGGDDILDGGAGNDSLYGEDGNDTLQGKTGNDMLYGGAGDDLLIGAENNDFLAGNGGDDVYRLKEWGADTIDELAGEGFDKVDISGLTITGSLSLATGGIQTIAASTTVLVTRAEVEGVHAGKRNDSGEVGYTVPGASGAITNVTFTYQGEEAAYNDVLFVYEAGEDGREKPGSKPVELFTGNVNKKGDRKTLPYASGTALSFYILQDGGAKIYANPAFNLDYVPNQQGGEPISGDHIASFEIQPGSLQFTWEDLLEGLPNPRDYIYDGDFNDLSFSIDAVAPPAPGFRFELRYNDLGLAPDPSPNSNGIQSQAYREHGHWVDHNNDGVMEPDQEDMQLPAAFVRNTKGIVEVRVIPVPAPGATLPDSLELQGFADDSISFPSTTAHRGEDGSYVFVIEATQAFRETVWHYDDFSVRWQTRSPGGEWRELGVSHNDIYLTLAAPAESGLMPHTLVHISSKYGKDATTRDDVIKNVWSYFKDLKVSRQDETSYIGSRELEFIGGPFRYWADYSKSGNIWLVDSFDCGGMSQLFLESLAVQGIDDESNLVRLEEDTGQQIAVNRWKTSGDPIEIDDKQYDAMIFGWVGDDAGIGEHMLNETRTGYNISANSQLLDVPGTEGQNSDNPASMFLGHTLVQLQIDGEVRWLDPSYGEEYVGDTVGKKLMDFENRMLYGFVIGLDSDVVSNLEVGFVRDLNMDGQITPDAQIDPSNMYHYQVIRRQDPTKTELTPDIGTYSGWST